jgi:hypothetical protein
MLAKKISNILPTLPLTMVHSLKMSATARAKKTKASSKRSSKKQLLTERPQSQASVAPSSHSQPLEPGSISDDEEKTPIHHGSVLDVDSTHTMDTSDGEEGTTGTAENPMEMSNWKKDQEEELGKMSSEYSKDKLNLPQT